jgi:hypothetical protein
MENLLKEIININELSTSLLQSVREFTFPTLAEITLLGG